MLRRTLLLSAISLTGCGLVTPTIVPNHKGPDAGTIVIGIGTIGSSHYAYGLDFRRTDEPANAQTGRQGGFWYGPSSFNSRTDYEDGDEHGAVFVGTLPEGEYELFNYQVEIINRAITSQPSGSVEAPISPCPTRSSGTWPLL